MLSKQSLDMCIGCGACSAICPKKCITIRWNEKGFFSSHIDTADCIQCEMCSKVCPISDRHSEEWSPEIFYGKHTDAKIVRESSSGGAFYSLAMQIFARGGVVFGVEFDVGSKQAKYGYAEDASSLRRLMKSKYVQADPCDAFSVVKEFLRSGRQVLFSAAPCTADGLKRYLNKEYDNLIIVDFVCHGTPSPMVLRDYLTSTEKKHHSQVADVDFRPKTYGWGEHSLKITFENKKVQDKKMMLDPYFKAFMADNMILNDNCYECPYTSFHCSDITLADFWGYKKVQSETDNDGISLIFANSEKGKQILQDCSDMQLRSVGREHLDYIFKKKPYGKELYKRQCAFFANYDGSKVEKCIEKHTGTSRIIAAIKEVLHTIRK